MEGDEGEKMDLRLQIPKLNRNNWSSEFKEAFRDLALNYGEAGDIIITGVDIDLLRPEINQRRFEVDENGNPLRDDEGRVIFVAQRRYEGEAGMHQFEKDEKRWMKLRDNKKKLISKLFMLMEREVRDKVTTSEGYEQAYGNYDLLSLWNIVEQVVLGRGAISIYALTARLLGLKQTGDYARFSKEFRESVVDLLRQGDPAEILESIINTLFVLALNQEQFKEKLTPIYGSRVWPNYEELSVELHAYVEATERLRKLRKDNDDGKIRANVAKQSEKFGSGCWNCGSQAHLKANCRAELSKCDNCGRMGHLSKYCQRKIETKETKRLDIPRAPAGDVAGRFDRSDRKRAMMKKAMAHLAEELAHMEDEDDYDGLHEYEGQDDIELAVLTNVTEVEEIAAAAFSCKDADDYSFIIDSGCKGAHICRKLELLDTVRTKNSVVQGITGHSLSATHIGELPGVGKTIIVPQAEANLLSLRQLVSKGGRFEGDSHNLVVYDASGQPILRASDKGDGFWRCSYNDLTKIQLHDTPITATSFNVPYERHFSAEERERAARAFELCKALGHPSDNVAITALDNGVFTHLDLTSQDLRNARLIHGPCTACLEAKMKAPSCPASSTPPASNIGEHLHMDLLPLSGTSIGGNTFLLVAVDEKSGYLATSPLKTKGAKAVCDAILGIVYFFNSYAHKVVRITTDDERTFHSTKDLIAKYGIQLHTTPSELHEKRCERYIQTLKSRKRAVLAALSYELPTALEGEALTYVANLMNLTPNTVTGTISPYQLVTGRKAQFPLYYFGQTGIFHSHRKDMDVKGEWGIFLGYGSHSHQYLRAYIPLRSAVYSRRKFVPHPHVPSEWNFPARLRPPAQKPCLDTSAPVTPSSLHESHPTSTLRYTPTYPVPSRFIPHTSNHHVQSGAPVSAPLLHSEGESPHPAPVLVPTTSPDTTMPDSEGAIDPLPSPPPFAHPSSTAIEPTLHSTPPAIPLTNPTAPSPPDHTSDVHDASTASPSAPVPPTPITSGSRPHRQASMQTWKDGPVKLRYCAYRLTINAALKDDTMRPSALSAINEEIKSMMDQNVMTPIRYSDIPSSPRRSIIPLHMFLKEKYKSDGTFDKLKARLVANGNFESPSSLSNTYAPTVNPISVMTILNIAASENRLISSYDIKSAFLMTPVTNGKTYYVKVPANVAQYWIQSYPHLTSFLHSDSSLYFTLNKYLYGLCEAPSRFNDMLHTHLSSAGFQRTQEDACLYTKATPDGTLTAAVHVDDILLTSPTKARQLWFESELEKHFEITKQYDNLSYLGLNIQSRDNSIFITQDKHISELINRYDLQHLSKFPPTPVSSDFRTRDPSSPPFDKSKFLSLVMSLMYIGRAT